MCQPMPKLALARAKSSWARVLLLKFVSQTILVARLSRSADLFTFKLLAGGVKLCVSDINKGEDFHPI
jgi:hypothetical protein